MRTLFQGCGRDVNRNEKQFAALPNNSFNDFARFLSAATAEFDQRFAVGEGAHDFVRVYRQDFVFGSGKVVLINLTNRFKQTRAKLIVKILWEKVLRRR